MLAANTGKSVEQRVRRDCERDHFLTADEAKEYGLIDQGHLPALIFYDAGAVTAALAFVSSCQRGNIMAKNDETNSQNLRCSFCGKHQDQVDRLIAGPGVYICNECVDAVQRAFWMTRRC